MSRKQPKTAAHEKPSCRSLAFLGAYVVVVHTLDTLAAQGIAAGINWRWLHWQSQNGFDWYKFIFWFAIPAAFSIRGMDLQYFGIKRWKKRDWLLLAGLAAAGALAVLSIPFVPSLRDSYEVIGVRDAVYMLVWTFSWIIGWEFLHRYVLLTKFAARWPRWGWLVAPFVEGVYHLQKPALEAAGMVLFSILASQWTLRRKNVLLPFLAHLLIEIELILFLILA